MGQSYLKNAALLTGADVLLRLAGMGLRIYLANALGGEGTETLTIVEDDADVEETAIVSSEELNQAVEIKYVPVAVEEEEPEEQTIFEVVEQMPEFPNGGMAGLMQYLSKNIKYPTIAQENGTQGRVTVQFVVNKDGSIVDAKVLRGVDPYLDKEAVRVIMGMPKWKPGMQRGKPVRVKYTVPVMFRLQ